MNYIELLGVKIATAKSTEIQTVLTDFLQSAGLKQIVTVNPGFLVTAHQDPEFKTILNSAALALPDGAGIVYLAKFTGQKVSTSNRMTGVELTHRLLKLAEAEKRSVAVIMPVNSLTSQEELNHSIRKFYPDIILKVILVSDDEEQLPTADIIFVALGAPQQEKWIWNHREKLLSTKIAVGVGGTFDFISGRIRRAPSWLQNLGLEWFWRLGQQPKRRWKRIFRAVVVFPWLVIKKS
jgi:N-acetylglucosaminyldiphosphoundecaprenol N-acetyl-beta-D-mannosaminyltransferase